MIPTLIKRLEEATGPTDEQVELAARAMLESKAWPVVYQPGTAKYLARVALDAALRARQGDEA